MDEKRLCVLCRDDEKKDDDLENMTFPWCCTMHVDVCSECKPTMRWDDCILHRKKAKQGEFIRMAVHAIISCLLGEILRRIGVFDTDLLMVPLCLVGDILNNTLQETESILRISIAFVDFLLLHLPYVVAVCSVCILVFWAISRLNTRRMAWIVVVTTCILCAVLMRPRQLVRQRVRRHQIRKRRTIWIEEK